MNEKAFFTDVVLFPFVKDIKRYRVRTFRDDLFAAFSVALLTIPQSIAYSLLAGLPPMAGLFAAIFGTIFVGVLGSSKHLIAGPTTSVAILLQTSISEVIYNYYPNVANGEREALVFYILCHIVFIMGILQIVFGLFNMGKILQFVSRSVILGYFVGVIIAIIINQLYPFLGVAASTKAGPVLYKLWELIIHLNQTSFIAAALGVVGILIMNFII